MKKVLNKYSEFARAIDKHIKVRKGGSFGCYPSEKKIEIPQVWAEEDIKDFIDYINKTYDINITYNISPELVCFLHEVGHIKQDKKSFVDSLCRPILVKMANWEILPKLTKILYYNLPKEQRATDWAVNYIYSHYEQMVEYSRQLGKTYKRYYKTMGVI